MGEGLFFTRCNVPTQKPIAPSSPFITETGIQIYPHSEKFKGTKDHGLSFYAYSDTCKSCHGKNLEGGNVKIACSSCHKYFPHASSFNTFFTHGAAFFENRISCAVCHGADYKGGNSKISCHTCHPYPHEKKWSFPALHGQAFTVTPSSCSVCHKPKSALHIQHPQHFVSCDECHVIIPHSDSFKYEGKHGEAAKSYEGMCTQCHTNYKKLFPHIGPEGCFECHPKEEIPKMKWRISK